MDYLPNLLVAYTTYLIGTASPGPANFAIMGTAMESGRRSGLAFALGVICGSQFWGITAAVGLGTLLNRFPTASAVLKVVGGLYLFWLAYRALRTAMTRPAAASAAAPATTKQPVNLKRHYLRGLGLHLTNPKAVLVWFTTISLGMPPGSPGYVAAFVVAGCAVLGITVFSTYAIVFSTAPMIRLYASFRQHINGVLAVVFAMAGAKLIIDQLG